MPNTGLEFECPPNFYPVVEGGVQRCEPGFMPDCWGRKHEQYSPEVDSCVCDDGYIRGVDTVDCVIVGSGTDPGYNPEQSQLHPSISQSKVPPTAYASISLPEIVKEPTFWIMAAVSAVASYMVMDITG